MIMPATWRCSNASTAACSLSAGRSSWVISTADPRACASSAMAWTTPEKNGSVRLGTATPMAVSRPVRKVWASRLGTYCNSSIAFWTRMRT